MGRNMLIAITLMFVLLGCQHSSWLLNDQPQRSVELKVQSVDSTRFSHYYSVDFRSRSGKRGAILIEKEVGLLPSNLYPKTGFQMLVLKDVAEFRDDNLTLRGHAVSGGFYVDGVRFIDLSPNAKRPFYSLIYKLD